MRVDSTGEPTDSDARAELDAFVYAVSHDLRAPIRSIRGFGQIIEEDHLDKLDEEGKDCIKRILAAAVKLTDMLDGILAYSRLTRKPVNIKEVDISALAREIAGLYEEGGTCKVAQIVVQDGLAAKTDEPLLRMALEELLLNACRFTAEEMRSIEVGRVGETFFVADNGRGFKEADAERIFKPFEKAHEPGGSGLGMGLTNVHRIFTMLGGRIWAESSLGQGSRFLFTLPDAG